MLTLYDISRMLYEILSTERIREALQGGGVYHLGDRPDDSDKADIVLHTTTITQDYNPQIAIAYVNIYVPSKVIRIKGKGQTKQDTQLMQRLTTLTLDALREATYERIATTIESQTPIYDPQTHQHCNSLRLMLNIQGADEVKPITANN